MMRAFASTLLAALVLVAGCKKSASSGDAGDAGSGGASLRIAVIPKGTTHEFWKSVHAGADKAAAEQHVEIVWKGLLKEDDLKGQIDVVDRRSRRKACPAMCSRRSSDRALVTSGPKAATAANIPVVVFDSDLQGDDQVSFVATDNVAAGKLAAERMAKDLGDAGGNAVVLRYQEGSASTTNAERAASSTASKTTRRSTSSATTSTRGRRRRRRSRRASTLLSERSRRRAAGVSGVFTPNESTTFGMLLSRSARRPSRTR